MKSIIIKSILASSIAAVLAISCQKLDYTQEMNWAFPLSGEWALRLEFGGTKLDGPFFLKVYNTSLGRDSVWIDDNGNIWPFKAKAKADMSSLSFSTTSFTSLPGTSNEDIVTITNGKVIGRDSIYFEAEFASDAGTIYKMYGHRASSYEEYNMPH